MYNAYSIYKDARGAKPASINRRSKNPGLWKLITQYPWARQNGPRICFHFAQVCVQTIGMLQEKIPRALHQQCLQHSL